MHGANLIVVLDKHGSITLVNGNYMPDIGIDIPSTSKHSVAEILELAIQYGLTVPEGSAPNLVLIPVPMLRQAGPPILAWEVQDQTEVVLISDEYGEIVNAFKNILTVGITVKDLGDEDLDQVSPESIRDYPIIYHDGEYRYHSDEGKYATEMLHKILDRYQSSFGLDSFDGKGSRVEAFVRADYVTSFYSSYPFDMIVLNNEGLNPGTIAHEFQHAVTQHKVILRTGEQYQESGAINEAVSDFMTSLFIDGNNKWNIMRNMLEPGKNKCLPLPEHVSKFYTAEALREHICCQLNKESFEDEIGYGIGHFNSTIISHALALIAAQGTYNGVNYYGIGEEKTAKIVLAALDRLYTNANFNGFYAAMLSACSDLAYANQTFISDCEGVRNGYLAVGIFRLSLPAI